MQVTKARTWLNMPKTFGTTASSMRFFGVQLTRVMNLHNQVLLHAKFRRDLFFTVVFL